MNQDALESFLKTLIVIIFFGVGSFCIPLFLLTQIVVPYNYICTFLFLSFGISIAAKEEARKAMLPFLFDRPMGSQEQSKSEKALEDLMKEWKKTKKL